MLAEMRAPRLRRPALASVLYWGAACSSSYGPEPGPIDPEHAAAAEAERERLRVEWEATMAERAAEAELERSVQGIESRPGAPLEPSEVSQLLLYYCGECHAADASVGPAHDGMFGIEDLDLMIEIGKIMPGDGAGSRLVVRMRDGRMPPESAERPPMPEPSVARIVAFIDDLAVPELAVPEQSPPEQSPSEQSPPED